MGTQPQIKAGGCERHEGPDHVLARSGKMKMDRVLYAVQDHPGKHSRQTEAVVAVDMREADTRDLAGRNSCQKHLPLGALPGVEEQALATPQQQISIVVAGPGGDL
jgi:hypothetical protein